MLLRSNRGSQLVISELGTEAVLRRIDLPQLPGPLLPAWAWHWEPATRSTSMLALCYGRAWNRTCEDIAEEAPSGVLLVDTYEGDWHIFKLSGRLYAEGSSVIGWSAAGLLLLYEADIDQPVFAAYDTGGKLVRRLESPVVDEVPLDAQSVEGSHHFSPCGRLVILLGAVSSDFWVWNLHSGVLCECFCRDLGWSHPSWDPVTSRLLLSSSDRHLMVCDAQAFQDSWRLTRKRSIYLDQVIRLRHAVSAGAVWTAGGGFVVSCGRQLVLYTLTPAADRQNPRVAHRFRLAEGSSFAGGTVTDPPPLAASWDGRCILGQAIRADGCPMLAVVDCDSGTLCQHAVSIDSTAVCWGPDGTSALLSCPDGKQHLLLTFD